MDDCSYHLGAGLFFAHPIHERLVNLQGVERKLCEITERGISRAEIVNLQADAELFESPKYIDGSVVLRDQDAFRNLKLQSAGLEFGLQQDGLHLLDDIGLLKLTN